MSRVITSIMLLLGLMLALQPTVFADDNETPITDVATAYTPNISIPNISEFSGTVNYQIPIPVPPGRQGIEPTLSLQYADGKKGLVGAAWSLELGAIQRQTKLGLDYIKDDYIHITTGSSTELVNKTGNEYCARILTDFTRLFDNGSAGWEAVSREGVRYYYGQTTTSRIEDVDVGTYRWALDRIEDPNGNYLTIEYNKDNGQLLPHEIRYTGSSRTGADPKNRIWFIYENRPDVFTDYGPQFKVETTHRLAQIRTYGNDQAGPIFKLTYEQNPLTNSSRLAAFQQFSADESASLPAQTFEWKNGSEGLFTTNPVYETSFYNTTHPQYTHFEDVNGDGLTDLIYFEPSYDTSTDFPYTHYRSVSLTIKPADGTGGFGAPYSSVLDLDLGTDISANSSYGKPSIKFINLNRDGRTDVLVTFKYGANEDTARNGKRVYLANSDGSFNPTPATVNFGPYYIPGIDINADGLSDIVRISNSTDVAPNWIVVHVSLANEDGTYGEEVATTIIDTAGSTSFADLNGDGLPDLMVDDPANRTAYPYRGDGTFVTDPNETISTGAGITSRTVDLNGDGRIDKTTSHTVHIVNEDMNHFDTVALYAQIARGDQDFGEITRTALSSCSGEKDLGLSMRFAELNGDGIKDVILLTTTEMGSSTTHHVYTYLGQAEGTPDRLYRIENGYGATTTITETYVKPSEKSFAPFPLYRIESIDVDSGVGPVNTTTYSNYLGCLWDAAERDFRGFASVETTYADDTAQYTEFEQGPYRKSRVKLVETTSTSTQNLLTWVGNVWLAVEDPAGFAHVKLSGRSTVTYDNPNNPGMTTGVDVEHFDYDDRNGYVTAIITSGVSNAEELTQIYGFEEFGDNIWRKVSEQLEGSTSGLVRQTAFRYDLLGNLTEEERYCLGGSDQDCFGTYIRNYDHDMFGNRDREWDEKHAPEDPPTVTITYDTDTRSFPVSVTNALGHATTQGWNYDYGQLAWREDVNGRRTNLQYDDVGRLEAVDYPDGGRKSFTYDFSASPYRVTADVLETAGQNITTWSDFDGLGRPVQTVARGEGGQYVVTKTHRDAVGRVTLATGPFFHTGNTYLDWAADGYPGTLDYARATTEYDARGRVLTTTTPDENQADATTVYLYNGYATTITDADDSARTLTRDHLDRIVAVTEHADTGDQITHYDYNAAGEMIEVRNALFEAAAAPDKFRIVMGYNTLGRKISLEDPDMGIWTYSYDANGNLASQTDGKGLTTTFVYDDLDRPKQKIFPAFPEGPTSFYFYCNTNNSANRALNLVGRLEKVSNANAVTRHLAYDAMGRAKKVRKEVKNASDLWHYGDFEYDYDLAGKLTQLTYPEDDLDSEDDVDEDNYTVTYDYHPGTGLIDTVSDSDGRQLASLTDYSVAGKIGTLTLDNLAATEYTYNPHSLRLTNITATTSQGAGIINKTYTYSPAGDITTIEDAMVGDTYTYTYDSLHRLTDEDSDGKLPPESMVIEFTYADGDTTQPLNAPETVKVNGVDYLLGYDENGNMTDGYNFTSPAAVLQRDIEFNSANMPRMVTNGSAQVDFRYDADGQRVLKAASGSSTLYFDTNFEVIDGTPTRYVFAGNLRIAKVTPTGIEYYHKDHLGSSTAMTGEAGLKSGGTAYLPFGMQRGTEGIASTGYTFTDQEKDGETGLYNYDARLYDPVIGRFVSADSVVPDWFDPQAVNRYGYVSNNPLKYTDPTGHWFTPETVWDLANVGMGMASFYSNLLAGNWGGVIADAAGVALDAAAVATPVVPGGASAALNAKRASDAAVEAAKKLDDVLAKRIADSVQASATNASKKGRYTKKGAKREPANKYWEPNRDRADMSEANKDLIDQKNSPKVDDDWVKQHPEDKKFYDETIELHHKNYQDDLIELPQNKHRGPDYYKDWHK